MVIITDGNGNIQSPTIPDNVYQGSNLANEIVFLAPLPQTNQAAINFKLPNGLLTKQFYMTPYTDVPSEYNLSAWRFVLPIDITQYYGQVDFQIQVVSADVVTGIEDDVPVATTVPHIVTTCRGSFQVLKGVAPIETIPNEEDPGYDTFADVLEALALLEARVENAEEDISNIDLDLESKQDTLVSGENIKTINSTSLLGSGNIDTKELFVCTYGTTTYVEVSNAISAGKLPIVVYNTNTYYYLKESVNSHIFSTMVGANHYEVKVNTLNQWNWSTTSLEETSNKVTSISSGSTDTQYPSAKAVYNAIQNVTIPVDSALSNSSENPVQNKVVTNALAGKQATLTQTQLDAVNSGIDSTKVGQIATNTSNITTINSKIPAQASSENQLADKNFVNSSIATNTANFIGTFANVTALNNYSGTITNNDYANVVNQQLDFATTTEMNNYNKALLTNFDYGWVVNSTKYDLYRFDIETQTWGLRATNISKGDVTLISAYNRYTYNGNLSQWAWNYTINTSGFTAAQWAAINSGITSGLVDDIVTKSNAQTITGAKTFSDNVTLDNNKFIKGKATGGTAYNLIGMNSGNGVVVGNSNVGLILGTSGNVIPSADGTKNLGSSSYKWNDIYLSGNLSDGTNSISVASIVANNVDVVHLTGDETIDGTKTFKKRPNLGIKAIPEGYTELEYLQGNGGYVDLGIKDNQVYGFEFKMLPITTSMPQYQAFFGGYYDNFNISWTNTFPYTFTAIRGNIYLNGETISVTTPSIWKYFNGTLYHNSTIASVGSGTLGTGNVNLNLYRCSSGNNTGTTLCKVYYLKLYDNNQNLIKYLVPVQQNSNDTLGFYDIVNNTFIQGTGSLIAGPEATVEVLDTIPLATTDDVATKVGLTGNETIAGTKTFSTRPLVGTTTPEGVALQSEIPTIEANNQESTTATLTKLKVGSVNYEIPSGGSGITNYQVIDKQNSVPINVIATSPDFIQVNEVVFEKIITSETPTTTYGYVPIQEALTTSWVNDGTVSKMIGFDSQGNIVKAIPSGGGTVYGWVDCQATTLTNTQTTTETSIDMSSFIINYDANGEYEALISITAQKDTWDYVMFSTDIIRSISSKGLVFVGGDNNENYKRITVIFPFKRYCYYNLYATGLSDFNITLLGYRRIK